MVHPSVPHDFSEARADAQGDGHASAGVPRAVRGLRGSASQRRPFLRPSGNRKDVDGEADLFFNVLVRFCMYIFLAFPRREAASSGFGWLTAPSRVAVL